MSARIRTWNDDGTKGESVVCPGDSWLTWAEQYDASGICWTVEQLAPFWPVVEGLS